MNLTRRQDRRQLTCQAIGVIVLTQGPGDPCGLTEKSQEPLVDLESMWYGARGGAPGSGVKRLGRQKSHCCAD